MAVSICGITVSPGDLIIADGSGIVCLPSDRAEEALGVAEEIVAKEQAMSRMLFSGLPINEVMGKSYETMLEARS